MGRDESIRARTRPSSRLVRSHAAVWGGSSPRKRPRNELPSAPPIYSTVKVSPAVCYSASSKQLLGCGGGQGRARRSALLDFPEALSRQSMLCTCTSSKKTSETLVFQQTDTKSLPAGLVVTCTEPAGSYPRISIHLPLRDSHAALPSFCANKPPGVNSGADQRSVTRDLRGVPSPTLKPDDRAVWDCETTNNRLFLCRRPLVTRDRPASSESQVAPVSGPLVRKVNKVYPCTRAWADMSVRCQMNCLGS
jgi:hypothetical protein